MDEREGKRRGLISSMLDLFGEEPPEVARPGYGFDPTSAPIPESDEPAQTAPTAPTDQPAVQRPQLLAVPDVHPTERPDGFRPVSPGEVIEAVPRSAAMPEPAVAEATPSDTSNLVALRAALSKVLATTGADAVAPGTVSSDGLLDRADDGFDDGYAAEAAAEVAEFAAEAARASRVIPTGETEAFHASQAIGAGPEPASASFAVVPGVPSQPAPSTHVDPATIQARVNEMLATTERLTKDLTAQAQAEADEIVELARRQADQHLARAREEATGILAKARSEAAGIATAADRSAEETRRAAEEEAEHIRGYARRNASMLVQAAQANRAQVQKNLEQVMSQSEFLSKEFVRALANLVAGMRPALESADAGVEHADPAPEAIALGGSDPGAVA